MLVLPTSVTNAMQIGKKTDRPRLIPSSREEKVSILHSQHNLHKKDYPTKFSLHLLQQKRNKQLRTELNKFNNCYIIKQGKITRRELAPPGQLLLTS